MDAWAEALSAGVTAPGDVMVMYGSTLFLIQMLDHPGGSPALWGPVGLFPGTHCLAAGTATAGSITDWLRRMTGERASFGKLAAEAAVAPRAGLAARYEELYHVYRGLYPATIGYAHQLAELEAASAV